MVRTAFTKNLHTILLLYPIDEIFQLFLPGNRGKRVKRREVFINVSRETKQKSSLSKTDGKKPEKFPVKREKTGRSLSCEGR